MFVHLHCSFTISVVDRCVSSPCVNNGNCTSFDGGYKCTCSPEYHGTNCEKSKYSDQKRSTAFFIEYKVVLWLAQDTDIENLVHLALYQRVVFKTTHFPYDPTTTASHCGCSSLIPSLRLVRTFFILGDPGAVRRDFRGRKRGIQMLLELAR